MKTIVDDIADDANALAELALKKHRAECFARASRMLLDAHATGASIAFGFIGAMGMAFAIQSNYARPEAEDPEADIDCAECGAPAFKKCRRGCVNEEL